MPAKISLTHLALHVRDLAASLAFYERFCGLRCIHCRGEPGQGPRVAWLAEPGKEREFILQDPDGTFVEFSYGQPLGPGAEALDERRVTGSAGY